MGVSWVDPGPDLFPKKLTTGVDGPYPVPNLLAFYGNQGGGPDSDPTWHYQGAYQFPHSDRCWP